MTTTRKNQRRTARTARQPLAAQLAALDQIIAARSRAVLIDLANDPDLLGCLIERADSKRDPFIELAEPLIRRELLRAASSRR